MYQVASHESCFFFHIFGCHILGSAQLFLSGFSTVIVLWGGVVSPTPNPQPGEPGLCIYDPWRQGGAAVRPGIGYSF
jgi:hypothetical protein